jgi:hypothetical protein
MDDAIEILLIEDDPQDVQLTLRALQGENLGNRIEIARDGEEALDFLFCRGPHANPYTPESAKAGFTRSEIAQSGRAAGPSGDQGPPGIPIDSSGRADLFGRAAGYPRDLQTGSEQLHSEASRHHSVPADH